MKSRDVVGRRVVSVRQSTFFNRHTGSKVCVLEAIVLEGGVEILFSATETGTDVVPTASVHRPVNHAAASVHRGETDDPASGG
jgi:hypothetical protein